MSAILTRPCLATLTRHDEVPLWLRAFFGAALHADGNGVAQCGAGEVCRMLAHSGETEPRTKRGASRALLKAEHIGLLTPGSSLDRVRLNQAFAHALHDERDKP